jgi:hypothetical protein
MLLSKKIKKAVEFHTEIIKLFYPEKGMENKDAFTRTHFNNMAVLINKNITRSVIGNPDLVAHYFVIGKLKLDKEILNLRCGSAQGFIDYLSKRSEYQVFNWVSGKTLQSYWNNGSAKLVKVNALLVFLKVPMNEWDDWMLERPKLQARDEASAIFPFKNPELNHAAFEIVKKYFGGNYYLYYQKTDGSDNIIKTPFVLKEHPSGKILVQSISEGHRYSGKVMGLRDGCLYINCQNLDFEEMEQYVFNIGLETNPEVLFGVSTTVSVKERLGVALKNILVKQKTNGEEFENEKEIEIPFSKKYKIVSEESIIVNYLKNSPHNIIKTMNCCNLSELIGS